MCSATACATVELGPEVYRLVAGNALAKGDEVVVAGGMLGKVSKLGDTYIGVEISSGVEVQMQRTAVAMVLPKGSIK